MSYCRLILRNCW